MNKIIIESLRKFSNNRFVFDTKTGKQFYYKDIYKKVIGVCNFLYSQNINKGSKVGIILNNSIEFVVIYIANLIMGATSIPINPNFQKNDFEYIIRKCNPDIILTSKAVIDIIKDSNELDKELFLDIYSHGLELDKCSSETPKFKFEDIKWEDIIAILFTSGTTGKPKGVVMKYGAVLENFTTYGTEMNFNENTRFMQVVPMFHAHGWLYSSLVPILFGSSFVLNQPFNAILCANFWNVVNEYEANALVCVPSILTSILTMKERYDFIPKGIIKHVICGSAFLHVDLKREFEEAYNTFIYEFYGSTETLYIAFHSSKKKFKVGTVGKLFPQNCSVKIAEDGEILVKTKYIFDKYLGEKELTENSFINGWYRSGDIGKIDEEGYVYLEGRKKDIINKGGYKIAPKEISICLLKHKGVLDVATVGVPDKMYGEEVYSFVVLKENIVLAEDELLDYCRTNLNVAICPKKVVILSDLPKNNVGKVDKFELYKFVNNF